MPITFTENDFSEAKSSRQPIAFDESDFQDAPDTSKLKISPYALLNQPSQFSSGLGANVPISENPDWAFTKAVTDPNSGLPAKLSSALSYAGNIAKAIPADVAETLSGDEKYYELKNLAGAALGEEPEITQKLSDAASESPTAATIGKISQGLAASAPLLGAAALPAWAGKLIAAGFSAQMISEAPEIARGLGEELGKNPDDRNQDKLTGLISDAIQTGLFAPMAGLHGTRDAIESKVAPKDFIARKIAEQLKAADLTKPYSAPQVLSADVSPIKDAEIVTKSGKPSTLSKQVQNLQPETAQTIEAVSKMSPDEFVAFTKGVNGGLTGEAWRIGQAIKTPEELASLKQQQESFSEQVKDAMAKKDFDTGISAALRGQFYREAYEAATGTGSAGEALKAKNPDYKPPLPIETTKATAAEIPAEKSAEVKQPESAKQALESVVYKTGGVGEVGGGVYPNVNTVRYGNKGEEVIYRRTDKKDAKGRVIFEAEPLAESIQPTSVQPEIVQEAAIESVTALDPKSGSPKEIVAPQKYRVGSSPQVHSLVEKLPQSEIEKANGEFPVKVRNDKTGQQNVVLMGDLTPIKERLAGEKQKAKASSADLDIQLNDAGLDPSVFKNVAQKKAALKRELAMTESGQGAVSLGSGSLSTLPASSALPVKSQRQIITDLSKGLKLPIRFGRLTTSKFSGYFQPIANLIGAKRANDIPIVSHEVGHKIDALFGLSKDPSIAVELNVLGDPKTVGSMSSWTPSKSKRYKLGEGIGEFVRHWLTDPAKAQKDAPTTFRVFEDVLDANKDVGDALRQSQQDINLWRTAEPQARLRSHISVGENPNKTPYTLSQLTRDLVDDLHILRLSVDDAQKGLGKDLPPTQNPYLLARNLRGSYGMAETFIRNGVADFNTKSVQLGKSFEDALSPIAGRINDFRDWIVAKRAQELMGQGRETGLLANDVIATASRFDSDAAFQKAFSDLKEWNDAVLKYSVDSGLVDAKGAESMRQMNRDYVPFHRLFEVGAGESASLASSGVGSGLNVGKPGSLKGLRGSSRQIVDPIETMVKNAYTVITASEKSVINRATAGMAGLPGMGKWIERVAAPKESVRLDLEKIKDQLEKAGADLSKVPDDLLLSFFKQSGRTPFGENIIKISRDGKPEFYRLNKDLFETFNALDLDDAGKLVRMLSAPAQLLRAGVTLEPSFNIANAMRDTFGSAVIGKYGALPFETTIKGVAAMLKNPQLVAEWAAAGGKSAVEANFFDRAKMQRFIAEKITKDLTPAERSLVVLKSPLTALRWLTSVGEEATRIGEYKIALKKLTDSGMPEGEARRLAAFESRDRQDFAKGGAKTKILRHLTPFWNASLQGNVKLAQAFKQRPIKTTLQGLAFVTTAKLIEQAINWNDDDYWSRPQWERDLFFMIPIGKDSSKHTRFLRVPTPFEVGLIFGTLPGRILQYAKTRHPEAMTSFPKTFLQQSVPNPIPSVVQLPFEVALSGKQGWSVYRGRSIVPDSMADLPPDLQFTEQTSRIAKKVGSAIGVSPLKIDHVIDSATGGMGKLLTGRSIPGKRFVTTPLTASNQPVDDFYSMLSKLREDAARVKATGNGVKPAALSGFESTANQISDLRSKARKETDEDKKAAIQNQIYVLVKKKMQEFEKLK